MLVGTAQTKQLSSSGHSSYWTRTGWGRSGSDAPRLGRQPRVRQFYIKPLVEARLDALEPLGVERLDGLGSAADESLGILVRLEVGEDVVGEITPVAPARPPHADAQPQEVGRPEVLGDGA